MLQTTQQQQRQRQQKFKFDQVKLNGMWDYLELDNYGQLNALKISEILTQKSEKGDNDNRQKLDMYLKYYGKMMKDWNEDKLEYVEKQKVDAWIQQKKTLRKIQQQIKKKLSPLTRLTNVNTEDVPAHWLETPPSIQHKEQLNTRTKILGYIKNQLQALESTFMFEMNPTQIQNTGSFNYWMFTSILSNYVQQQTTTNKQKIMLFLLSKLIYEQIFKFWKSINLDKEFKKILIPSPSSSNISAAYTQRYDAIKQSTTIKYSDLVKDVTLEDVIDYLLAMQTYETQYKYKNTLTPQQQNCLNQIKEKALYPLLYSKFFRADLPIQPLDSETIKRIKRKLHKLKCGFLPRLLCNFLFNSFIYDDDRYKYFMTLLKQGDFGDFGKEITRIRELTNMDNFELNGQVPQPVV